MTSSQKLDKIANDAIAWLKETDFKKSVERHYKENRAVARDEAKKAKMTLDRFNDMYPDEWYAYLKFRKSGEIIGYDIDHAQYWQGYGGPVVTIFLTPKLAWKDVRSEIGNTLYDQLDLEDD